MTASSQKYPLEHVKRSVPLCVDLDGTLVKSDTLIEALLVLAKTRPLDLLRFPAWLVGGKAFFKARVTERVDIDPALLPYNEMLLDVLKDEKESGRELILATASNENVARPIADYLGIFSEVVASDSRINYSGETKLEALKHRFGGGNFDYAANGRVDIPVWVHARAAWLVNPDRGVEARLEGIARIERRIETRGARKGVLLAMLHTRQWLEILFVLPPLLLAHRWEFLSPVQAALGVIAFSLSTSGASLMHDLLNLQRERSHPTKKQGPLASGEFSQKAAGLLAVAALLAGFSVVAFLPSAFWALLACYLVLRLSYSLYS